MDSNSFFFNNVDMDFLDDISIEQLKSYSQENAQRMYLIKQPLSEKKYDYTVNKVLIFLCPDYNIQLVNLNLKQDDFDEMYLDFTEDLGHIADKYNYTDIISRPRHWKPFIKKIDASNFFKATATTHAINDFMSSNQLENDLQKRTVKLLISLLTGSINSAEKVGKELPKSTLEKVKQNIILFDGDQTRFIFEESYKDKIIKVQGLAGTGKTELLLHRLKELYVSEKEAKIAFTCQSKTLSNRLKNRVTEFFNFMQVAEQIEWEERLWVMHAWGSVKDSYNLGTYGLICKKYNLPFYTARESSFAAACQKTLDYAKSLEIDFEPFFDYMLIDEGQDFTEEFIELCSLFTKNEVFVAGDIFQDIFGIQKIETNPHYLLNKCYRTDPRTLMFSHALGMGLYEQPSLRFLTDEEWLACGYKFKKNQTNYLLSREPVTRFENLDPLMNPSSMHIIESDETPTIIQAIKQIQTDYPDVSPDDIAVVYPNPNLNYKKIDDLEFAVYQHLSWNVNVIHNTKETYPNTLTVSNRNNIKGLEFPFVICVVDYSVNKNPTMRNTLYMTLTRSFISSYLLIGKIQNAELILTLEKGLDEINSSLQMTIPEPTQEEREHQERIIKQYNKPVQNQHDILTDVFDGLNVSKDRRPYLRDVVSQFRPNETNKEKLRMFISTLLG